jgi:hypothetical protein
MLSTLLALQVLAAAPGGDPFAFFRPTIDVTADDRRRLDRGVPIAHVLPAAGHEVAIVAVVPVDIDGDRLVAWMRRIEALKKSAYVPAIRRFSDPPRLEDLAGLSLDDEELSQIPDCRPGHCGLKLSAAEMMALHRAASDAGSDWRRAVLARFRELALARVEHYLSDGAIDPYEDHSEEVRPARLLATLVDHTAFLTAHAPAFADYLRRAPQPPPAGVESFMYWSTERIANTPVTSITQVSMLRGGSVSMPEVLVAGRQIYATHYLDASLGITALVRGEPGGPNYLVYLNRSQLDVLHGVFGGMVRWIVQRRLQAEAVEILDGLRRRLESGDPPPAGVTSASGSGAVPVQPQ